MAYRSSEDARKGPHPTSTPPRPYNNYGIWLPIVIVVRAGVVGWRVGTFTVALGLLIRLDCVMPDWPLYPGGIVCHEDKHKAPTFFHWEVFGKGTGEVCAVILSAAKNLSPGGTEILRCAQDDMVNLTR